MRSGFTWAAGALGALALTAVFTAHAQQVTGQTGNVVTIFGQEKVEKTDEGQVFHRFERGLFLPGGVGSGTLFNGQDMIAWLYAAGEFRTPQAGDTVPHSYPGEAERQAAQRARMERMMSGRGGGNRGNRGGGAAWAQRAMAPAWKWAEIQADSAGVFQHFQLRGAYLYTAYEAPKSQIALLETTGGTRTYINGFPHEGDHYDFGYTLTPIKLKKGLNEFVYTPGRFGRVAAKLVMPDKPVLLTKRDMTLPDLITGEGDQKWGAIRVVNATEGELRDLTIRTTGPDGQRVSYKTGNVMPLAVRKLAFKLPAAGPKEAEGRLTIKVELLRGSSVVDAVDIELRQVSGSVHHERTFISRVDGSVQYFSVAPALRDGDPAGYGQQKALVLSVHGAGVEARNQARAYKQKEWVDIVAATNRRPYGFNWEEWGRIDALEVLAQAKRIFRPDTSRIYLTGHSMGGHGTWHLGTTFPDKFAAIAPCASYPDIARYGRNNGDAAHDGFPAYGAFQRAANGGRTLSLIQNLKQSGVYIFHGDADRVVATDQARMMREVLGKFHPDFCYYEYPGGEHWFGNHSVDWKPIFDYFARHSIPAYRDVKTIDFWTASPNISAQDYWLRVEQQHTSYNFTNVQATVDGDTIRVTTVDNADLLVIDLPALELGAKEAVIAIDKQSISVPTDRKAYLEYRMWRWETIGGIDPKHKYSGRSGGFKNAFDNNVVLVYATGGSAAEQEWYRNKARFDAETFYYRGNGSPEVIADREYSPARYRDRNVVLYGNSSNNKAWNTLLRGAPVQVKKGEITVGDAKYTGDDLGVYFIYPNPYSDVASVGVVAGTGVKGMWATSANNYISGITGFPDLMVFRSDMLREGLQQLVITGFFDNHWSFNRKDLIGQ